VSDEHRLPSNAVPRAYRLVLEPDLEAFTFRGSVEIDVEFADPAAEIVLHAAELEIRSARAGPTALGVRLDPSKDRLVLTAPGPLPAGKAVLSLEFTGVLNDRMRGFYRSAYTRSDGSRGVRATTQFESTSARRAFPCFDEPALKAVFEVTLVVPAALTAVSNMPVRSEAKEGVRRRVRYAPTPVMSTYLLAFAVGEFESLEATTKDGVPVRVYATPGRIGLCRFALETAVRGLEFFDAYYGIPYRESLPKCDLLAIPDFEFGAMENWGAITFRETAIFVDPEQSSVPQRRRVAEVVLHELAHQWFGNLVSPEWWSYLWLNESFATYMAYKASDALFPEWKVWEEYLAQITSAGKSLDSLRSSHPVEVLVRDPSEVDQIFDAISYNKGGSVLRMLEGAIGEEAFRNGIRRYLERHAYGNATTDDLWKALGEVAGIDVGPMMDGWTRRTGLPVVLADREADSLRLRQERFFLDRDPDRPEADPTAWDIPLPVQGSSGAKRVERLVKREAVVRFAGEAWVKLNAGQTGFYLVSYGGGWPKIGEAIQSGALSAVDRYGLQEDAYSLMRAGYLPVPAYLSLVNAFSREDNYHVWAGLMEGVAALEEIFSGDPAIPRLQEWARGLLAPRVRDVGWDEKPGESHDRVLLRATVLSAAVHFGDPEAVAGVRERFAALRRDLGAVSPNLRSMTLTGAARHGGDEVLDHLAELHAKADLPEVKVQVLRAMGAFRREAPLRRAVAYALSDRVRLQDAMYVFAGTPAETKPVMWGLLKEHWPVIHERYGKSVLIAHFISWSAGGIPREDHARDVEAFFKDHPAPYATEKIRQTLEGIRARAKFRARHAGALSAFFASG
jgi:aminopeptidase N